MSNRWERILVIDREIRAGNYPSPQELAELLEVSERTIYLDRQYMVDRMHAPIAYDPDARGYYYTDKNWVLPQVFVTEGELLALLLSRELTEHYLGTSFEEPLHSAIRKISRYLPDKVRVDLDAVSHHYSFLGSPVVRVEPRLIEALREAITARRCVRVTYYTASRGEQRERLIDPYHLCNIRGDWYLIGYDHWRKDYRLFHLGRFIDWHVTDERFERDPHFDVEQYMRPAFLVERGGEVMEVVIRFDAVQARYIRERRWHPTQAPLKELPDGGVILRFQAAGLMEVKRWVMGYGAHAEVLGPENLRREVMAEVEKMQKLYGVERSLQ